MGRSDARVERTRKALIGAFVALFFERPYARISVGAIVARARVGRSTFYEHFVDKEDLLAASMGGVLTVLASSVDRGASAAAMKHTIDHFAANADQARALLGGSARRPIARALAAKIEARLAARGGWTAGRAVAVALSEAILGTIAAWLRGEIDQSSREIADVLHRIAGRCAAE
jgi:AcrR family transcriptional regulator